MVKVRDNKLAASRILVLENIVFPALRIQEAGLRRFSLFRGWKPKCVRLEPGVGDDVIAEWQAQRAPSFVQPEDMSLAADFELMDSAGKWHAARIVNFKDSWMWRSKKNVKNGEFEGNAIELVADGVAGPKAVRYLFNSPWQGSVFNEASLPLGPFAMAVEEMKKR